MARAAIITLAVVLWSFCWTCLVGHFGIFTFDQSMMFDGAWRILSGQVPFKDFIMAFGPVSFAIQALFFKIFGVTWTTMVLAAAAAVSVMRSMALLFGRERVWLVAGAGFLVGTSIQSMFGTLWIEQVAFFFCLLALQALCESLHCRTGPRLACFSLAGALSALAFFTKQNAGGATLAFIAF